MNLVSSENRVNGNLFEKQLYWDEADPAETSLSASIKPCCDPMIVWENNIVGNGTDQNKCQD